jgi:hypothetical protein
MNPETGGEISERRMHESPNFKFDLETLERLKKESAADLGEVFVKSRGLIESADLDDKQRRQLIGLLDDVKETANRYVERVIVSTEVSEVPFPADTAERARYQHLVQASDRSRRQSHLNLIGALNALFRNMMKMGISEAEVFANALSGDPNDAIHRRRVGEAAVLYGWNKAKKTSDTSVAVGTDEIGGSPEHR